MENKDASADTQRSYKAACFRRWTKLSAQSPSPICNYWYNAKAKLLLDEDPGLDLVEPPKRTD